MDLVMTSEEILIEKPNSQAPRARRIHISRAHILRSVLSNWSYLIVSAIVAFLITPFVLRHLGDSAYGIWALVLQLTGYMGVVDVGLRSALVRFVSSTHTTKDHDGLNRLLSGVIMIYGVMAPLSLILGGFLAVFALPHMHTGPEMLRKAQITLCIAALIIACDFLFATFHASLAGLSRWHLINMLGISGILVRTGLIVGFIKHGYGLVTLALIQLSVNVAIYVIEVVMVRNIIPEFRFIWEKPNMERLRPVLQHSWSSLLLSLANRINYQVDTIVIAIFLPIGEVTYYVIGLRLIEYLRDILNSTTMIAAPLVSSLHATGDSDRVVAMLVRGTKYSLFVAFLGIAGFLTMGTDFIGLWMGPRFTLLSGGVLIILTLGLLASCNQFASSHVLYGLGKHQINLNWTLVESVVNFGFSLLLVRRYGILGVAAGTTLANFLIRGWFYPRAVLKSLQLDWRPYVIQGVLTPLIPALWFAAAAELFRIFFPIRNYWEFILAVLFGMLSYAIGLWLFGLDDQDRAIIRQNAKKAPGWS
jgi:O-antigen/teichoic acid export membrane protein